MTKTSAPGKIILFGEHAVVYGQPALAVPVHQVHADVEIIETEGGGIWVNAPDIGVHKKLFDLLPDHPLGLIISPFLAAFVVSGKKGIEINVSSSIPIASGLGSGAAISVAMIRALSEHIPLPLDDEQVNEMAYEMEKIYHGTPSGIDNTVVTYGKPIFFSPPWSPPQAGGKPRRGGGASIETLNVAKPFTIIIGDTGIPAPTKESVADVRKLWEQDKDKMEMLFGVAGSLARTARQSIEGGHPERLGALMNENQRVLTEMGVSSPELDKLVAASLNAGASGAKLSGGGIGGNMIALSTKENAPTIVEALYTAGAKNVIVTEVS